MGGASRLHPQVFGHLRRYILVLRLAAAVTPLEVAGFGAALVGALVLSLVSLVLSWALKD